MVAAGTDDVDDHRQVVFDVKTALAHGARRADDFVGALPFRGQRYEQSGRLRWREIAVHDLSDESRSLRLREALSRKQTAQKAGRIGRGRCSIHSERKFSARVLPCSLKTDSG